MNDGRALGIAACPDGRQNSRDTRSDILTKQYIDRMTQIDDPTHR